MNLRYDPIPKHFYEGNRAAFSSSLKPNSIAIILGKGNIRTNADGQMGFRQGTGFFYLTGIDQADAALVIVKGINDVTETLFITESNEHIAIWEGEKLSVPEAQELSGISDVSYIDNLWNHIKKYTRLIDHVYIYIDIEIEKDTWIQTQEKLLQTRLKRIFPHKTYCNPANIINSLRQVKHNPEIEQIKKAISITSLGFSAFCKQLKAGKFAYEMEAVLSHAFMVNKSRYHAFEPIIASGINACTLHYTHNANRLENGQCVLLDFGAEYGNYAADVTRVLPVGGTFSQRQSEVYSAVYEVFEGLKKYVKPGQKLADIRKESQAMVRKQLVALGILERGSLGQIKTFYPHGPSHFLGLDVHDVGDKNSVLKAGMVITCEPGIYVKQESLGIRLENDLLITETGNVDLCADIPIAINEIEKLIL